MRGNISITRLHPTPPSLEIALQCTHWMNDVSVDLSAVLAIEVPNDRIVDPRNIVDIPMLLVIDLDPM